MKSSVLSVLLLIVIVVLLIAALLPALGKARRSAQNVHPYPSMEDGAPSADRRGSYAFDPRYGGGHSPFGGGNELAGRQGWFAAGAGMRRCRGNRDHLARSFRADRPFTGLATVGASAERRDHTTRRLSSDPRTVFEIFEILARSRVLLRAVR